MDGEVVFIIIDGLFVFNCFYVKIVVQGGDIGKVFFVMDDDFIFEIIMWDFFLDDVLYFIWRKGVYIIFSCYDLYVICIYRFDDGVFDNLFVFEVNDVYFVLFKGCNGYQGYKVSE